MAVVTGSASELTQEQVEALLITPLQSQSVILSSEARLLDESIRSLKALIRYSNEMARQSIIALDQAIKRRLVKDVGDAVDQAFIDGDGDIVAGTDDAHRHPDHARRLRCGRVRRDHY